MQAIGGRSGFTFGLLVVTMQAGNPYTQPVAQLMPLDQGWGEMQRVFAGLVVAALTLTATQAGAITGGRKDKGNAYPNVGLVIVEVPQTGEKDWACSGTLIAPKVFLSAAHCASLITAFGVEKVWITFDRRFTDSATLIKSPARVIHPGFDPHTLANDLAVFTLARAARTKFPGAQPAELPNEGLLEKLQREGTLRDQGWTNVGYGLVATFSPPAFSFDGWRRISTSPTMALTKRWLKLHSNISKTGQGGTCRGDSGGPVFLGNSAMIVATHSAGDAVCRAVSFSVRLDTRASLDFLEPYVP
jgi:secreted trypsin-like serine protease